MNDGGSIRVEDGNEVHISTGNKILNNRIHDVTDAGIMDPDGYGGHGIYMDNQSGLVDVENNLVYRVSASAIYTPHGPAFPGKANTIKNNILAFARTSMIDDSGPYQYGVPTSANQSFVVTGNLFYFDRNEASGPPFRAEAGCTYSAGFPFPEFEEFFNNMYWRTDGAFASDPKAFHVQPNPGTGPNAPCSDDKTTWTFYTLAQWQSTELEDAGSVVKNPGFANSAYPADDYSLPNGSPGAGFVVFDACEDGVLQDPAIHAAFDPRPLDPCPRGRPHLSPGLPAIPATFPTATYNPATDY